MVRIGNEGFLKVSFDGPLECERPERMYPFANSKVFETNVIHMKKLTEGEDVKDVYDIALDVTDIEYNYQPGDTIGILPYNDYNEVCKILESLNCAEFADKECFLLIDNEKKHKNYAHLPTRSTIRNLFLKAVDIRTPPKKAFLKTLSKHCSDEGDRNFVEDLSTPNKSEEYMKFISSDARTLLGLLKKLPSCKPPLDVILENLTPLQPRPYSIASSPLLKNKLHITFSVVNFTENLRGVCSSYLEEAGSKLDKIDFYFRKPSLRICYDSSPIIMVGPGTGIAPFKGFLQHLSLQSQRADTWLIYGCRYNQRDFLYYSDIQKYLCHGSLSKLTVAFSREQINKVYVTDLISNESSLMYKKIVNENATFYVCGDAKNMVRDVKNAVLVCLEENGMSIEEAEDFIKLRVKENKYIEEKWV